MHRKHSLALSLILLSLLTFTFISAQMPEPSIVQRGEWTSQLVTQEFDGDGDGLPDVFTEFTDLGDGLIQINVYQTSDDKKYKWQSGIFTEQNANIEKFEYNPATEVWTSTGNLNLFDYQWTTGWEAYGRGEGYSLFGSGSGNKTFRLILPEGLTNFTIFTGENSEQVSYNYTEEKILNYNTDTYDKYGHNIVVLADNERIENDCMDWISNEEGTMFWVNFTCSNITDSINELTFRDYNNANLTMSEDKIKTSNLENSKGFVKIYDKKGSLIIGNNLEINEVKNFESTSQIASCISQYPLSPILGWNCFQETYYYDITATNVSSGYLNISYEYNEIEPWEYETSQDEDIISIKGLTRSSERIRKTDGNYYTRAYSYSTPHYYINSDGEVLPINMNPVIENNVSFWNESVVSISFDYETGQVTMIPDVALGTGNELLTIDVTNVLFNNNSQEIEVGTNIFPNPQRWGARQVVKVEEQIDNFEIDYLLNVTGLDIVEKNNEFWFYSGDEFRFRILAPLFLDENLDALTHEGINHELIDNQDGTYTYKKFSTEDFNGSSMPDTYYIDADTYYGTTADGHVGSPQSSDWDTVHDATTGISVTTTNSVISMFMGALGSYYFPRGFLYFDTSNITGTVDNASLFIYGQFSDSNIEVSVQEGTQADTLTVDDFDSFSGSEYGHTSGFAVDQYNEISFNQDGKDGINTSGTTKICARIYDYDYLDVDPGFAGYPEATFYSADETGTDKDPYLEITEGGNTAPNNITVTLTSVNGLNSTQQNLNASGLITDPEGDTMNLTVKWYKNEILNRTTTYTSIASGTLFMGNLSAGNLTVDDVWRVTMNSSDGFLGSAINSSNNLTILSTPTSMLQKKINVSSFTISSDVYVPIYSLQVNTSDTTAVLATIDSFNVAKLTGASTNDVYVNITIDGVTVADELVRTVSKDAGVLDEGIALTAPNVTTLSPGQHTITWSARRTGTGDVQFNDIDLSIMKMKSSLGNKVNAFVQSNTLNFNSTTFQDQINYTFNFSMPTAVEPFVLGSIKLNASAPTTVACYVRNNDYGLISPITVTSIPSAGVTRSSEISVISPIRQKVFNTTIFCLSTTGANVTMRLTALNTPMRDNRGNAIGYNIGLNSTTNYTINRTLTAGSHSLANTTITPQNGTNVMLTMSSYVGSATLQNAQIYYKTNATNAECYSKKDRLITANGIGSLFINVICNNLSVGESYSFDFRLNNTATVTVYDEIINVFEGTPLDTSVLNTPPIVTITNYDDVYNNLYGNSTVEFSIVDEQSDPYLLNINVTNSTGSYVVVSDYPDGVNYTWDTTLFADGNYNFTLQVCENTTADLFCGSDTVPITITQSPLITITYPINGSTYTSDTMTMNATVTGSMLEYCWASTDDGITNSTAKNASSGFVNFTGLSDGEGTNVWTMYCNNSMGNVGSSTVTFFGDFPPVPQIFTPTTSPQNLVLEYNATCTDTQGVSIQKYSVNGKANVTYTEPLDLYLSARTSNTIIHWCQDTYGSWNFTSVTFYTRDFDTNATTECPDGYYLDGDGSCKVDQTGGGGSTTIINNIVRKQAKYCPKGGVYCDCSIFGSC